MLFHKKNWIFGSCGSSQAPSFKIEREQALTSPFFVVLHRRRTGQETRELPEAEIFGARRRGAFQMSEFSARAWNSVQEVTWDAGRARQGAAEAAHLGIDRRVFGQAKLAEQRLQKGPCAVQQVTFGRYGDGVQERRISFDQMCLKEWKFGSR